MPTQIEVLANLQTVDQSLRTKSLAVAEGEGRVAALEEAVRGQTAAANAARKEAQGLTARQRDLESRLTAAETKMKDRRMRITRIRNDKELGLAKREVELLKEETGTLETELVAVMEQAEAATAKLQGLPSEYFMRQCFISVDADEDQVEWVIRKLGDDTLVFSTDYPHSDSHFPEATDLFLKLPISEASKRKILWDNCARLYGLR